MRILSITAGAAEMYCGSCLRDNALARALLQLGHDVTLMPLYTPTRVDEENVSTDRVFLGGVSVFLEQYVPLFRRTPWLLDRVWDSKGFLNLASKRSIQVAPDRLGALTISTLLGERGFQRKEVDKLVHWIRHEPSFDVINLPNALLIGLATPIRRATGRPVVVTLQGEDLFLEGLPHTDKARAIELIRAQIPGVDLFVSVSNYYRDFTSSYFGIPYGRIHVVPLGVSEDDLTPTTRTRVPSDPFIVGYLARVAPEKSLHLLAEAYRRMRQDLGLPPSRIEVAGYLAPEYRPYLKEIEERLRAWGLADEFRYHGELDRAAKVAFLHSIDVLSVPSTYVEPKGLYLLEAMACGVPVVAPNHGAFPEMIDKTDGGLLVAPNDPSAFADGMLAIRNNPARAREMGLRGASAVRRHYSVRHMAERVLAAYEEAIAASTVRATS